MREGWDGWRILEPISGGASGTVYRACREGCPEYLSAIKIVDIPEDSGQTEEMRRTGMSEEQIRSAFAWRTEKIVDGILRMSRFRGISHLVSIEDFKVEEQAEGPERRVLIRMEYLKPLPAYLTDKKLGETETLRMGIDLCKALEVLHGSGVIHQDIKPDNIFVNERLPGGVIYKLGDLDSLRDLSGNDGGVNIKGTPSYLAPEVPAGGETDARTDLYELGLTLYQTMNGGRLPFLPKRQFASHHDLEIAVQIRLNGTELPPPAEASEEFGRILRKACAFRPEERYQSAAEMRRAMEELAETLPEAGKTALKEPGEEKKKAGQRGNQARRTGWKKIIPFAAAGLAIGALILGGIFGGGIREERKTVPADEPASHRTQTESAADPLTERIQAVSRETAEQRIIQEDGKCRIPVSLEAIPAVAGLDSWLEETYPTWKRAAKDLCPAALPDQNLCVWKDSTGRQNLEIQYSETGEEMTEWMLMLQMPDRANGWGVSRSRKNPEGWTIRWYPPLRTRILGEYLPDGTLLTITRGNQKYEAKDGLPALQGVEYIQ